MPVMFDWDIFELGEKRIGSQSLIRQTGSRVHMGAMTQPMFGPGVPLCFKFLSSLLSTLPKGHVAGTHLSAL